MSTFDWNPYAVGGAVRPDTFSGMDPQFASALAQMFSSAPSEIQQSLRVSSGYRSPERQAELWQGALKKYGSAEAARKWVAPPGRSQHNHGHAADLKYLSPAALKWAHDNAGNYGLAFPLSNENWHVELAGSRGGKRAPQQTFGDAVAASTQPPAATPAVASVQQAPAGFGDAVTTQMPQQTDAPNFNRVMLTFLQNTAAAQRLRDEEAAADQQRRAALFDESALASLYG